MEAFGGDLHHLVKGTSLKASVKETGEFSFPKPLATSETLHSAAFP